MARPKSDRRGVRLSVTLDEEDHKAVREMAEAMDISMAWVVRRAVSEFIGRHGNGKGLLLPNPDDQTV